MKELIKKGSSHHKEPRSIRPIDTSIAGSETETAAAAITLPSAGRAALRLRAISDIEEPNLPEDDA